MFIVPTRKTCAEYNKKYINSLEGKEIKIKAQHYHATQKKFTPFIDKKEGAVGTTAFQDELILKLGAKIIIIHNIDTSDGLTNGQLGELVKVIYTKNGEADKLIIKLRKKGVGVENRKKFSGFVNNYPDSVVVEKVSINYSIRKKGGAVGSTATLVQFPVKLAHAITSHKIQGQTVPKPMKVAYDINSCFEEAQGYVMLSRVQKLDQVYILNKFNPKKLYPSQKALQELERMNKVSINENPGPWSKNDENSVKVVSMNCAGLRAHFDDVKTDDRLMKADIMHLIETSMTEDDKEDEFLLEGFKHSFIKCGKGKGIATYYRTKFEFVEEVKMPKFQMTKFKHDTLDVINVYRSQAGNSFEVLDHLRKLINSDRVTLITGDFNSCFMENFSSRLIQGIINLGFRQLVHEATHIHGRHIDHAYILDPNGQLNILVERHSTYFSDHDGICVILSKIKPEEVALTGSKENHPLKKIGLCK